MSEISRLKASIASPSVSWDNRCLYILRFHDLMQAERGIGKPKSFHGWSLRDTATELGIPLGTLHRDIECARLLPEFPIVRKKCGSANAFLKAIIGGLEKMKEEKS